MSALRVARPPSISQSACYRYYVYLRPQQLAPRWNRDRIQAAITEQGIPCSAGSCSEIYLEKAIPKKLRPKKRLPVARELGETSLAFLVHPTLSEENMRETAEVVETVLEEASR
jgi:dTDP-4-amino-4,6-dideoxygalactose transaminase